MTIAVVKTRGSLQEIVQNWKDQIICLSPKGEGYNAYLVDSQTGNICNYIHADCDTLRHLATNYDTLLIKIKNQHQGYLKEVILNTIKYEVTRRAFKKQHQWIHDSYQNLIRQKKNNIEQQSCEIEQLKKIVKEHNREISLLKSQCRERLSQLQVDTLIKQKEAELQAKNVEIERLNQKLNESDREIKTLKSELNNGLNELKLKYKWLITQFIQERSEQQKIDRKNKSLKTCQKLFKKAQQRINALNHENRYLKQENIELQNKIKMLRV